MQEKKRIHMLDAVRGMAVLLMVVFHAFFTYGVLFGFPFFQRGYAAAEEIAPPVISTLFIFSCAYSCLLSKNNIRRGLIIFAVAMGMSVVTIWILPLLGIEGEGIWFGILHCLGICVLLSPLLFRLLRKIPWYLSIPVLLVLAIGTRSLMREGFFGVEVQDPIQSVNLLFPFGIFHGDFYSADYYPLFPYLFVFAIGCVLALRFPPEKLPARFYQKICPPLEWLGRHALVIYVVHQPLLYAVGFAAQTLLG